METKELKVAVPEGFEIDVEKSNFKTGDIVLKEVKEEFEWKDFGEVEGWWIDMGSDLNSCAGSSGNHNRNIYPTKELARAALALCQLLQWRNKVWKEDNNWEPNWLDGSIKHKIGVLSNKIDVDDCYHDNKILVFRTIEIRDKFLKQHRSLIEQAKELL